MDSQHGYTVGLTHKDVAVCHTCILQVYLVLGVVVCPKIFYKFYGISTAKVTEARKAVQADQRNTEHAR